jgi:hypothetical protein
LPGIKDVLFFLIARETAGSMIGVMSAIRLPVTRPAGRVLLVGSESCRAGLLGMLGESGFSCGESENPYSGILELVKNAGNYSAVLLCLNSIFREELPLIAAVKKRWPNMDVWLAQTESRQSAMNEALNFGADGLFNEKGLHRIAPVAKSVEANVAKPARTKAESSPKLPGAAVAAKSVVPVKSKRNSSGNIPAKKSGKTDNKQVVSVDPAKYVDDSSGDPILTADELRALLTDPAEQQQRE